MVNLARFTWLPTRPTLQAGKLAKRFLLYDFPRAHTEGTREVLSLLVSLSLLPHIGVSPATWHRAHVSSSEPLQRKLETGYAASPLCSAPSPQVNAWIWERGGQAACLQSCQISPFLCPSSFSSLALRRFPFFSVSSSPLLKMWEPCLVQCKAI